METKTKKWIWISFLAILLTLALSIVCLLFIRVNNMKMVTMNREKRLMSNMTLESFNSLYDDLTITFVEGEIQTSYSYKDLDIGLKWTDEQLDLVNKFAVNLDNVKLTFNYSQKLKELVDGLNDERNDWVSATFVETENTFLLTEEQAGNKVDTQAIETYISSKLGSKSFVVDLNKFKHERPDDFTTAQRYEQEASKWANFNISYSNGFALKGDDVKSFFTLTDEYRIVFKEETEDALKAKVQEWITNDLQSYNALGSKFSFTTHNNEVVEIEGVNCGDKLDEDAEAKYLVQSIKNLDSNDSRVPELSFNYSGNIQNNVIEISIEDQHLWYWQNGEVLMETDIITGYKDKWDTPKGAYKIVNMAEETYITVADNSIWVARWIELGDNFGLYDAQWRSEFGGTIYEGDGSSGCVNIPYEAMLELYDLVNLEDCVVIY